MYDVLKLRSKKSFTQALLSKFYYQSLKLDCNYNLINFVKQISKNRLKTEESSH
jgi:hypothetical protein